MSSRTRALVLAVVATDVTFVRARYGDGEAFIGKCLHCGARLVVGLDGEPVSRATIEHVRPRAHGGTDALENLALACARCNSEKGVRHDAKPRFDGRLAEVVESLAKRRMERWVEPPDAVREAHARYLARREPPRKRR
jgi:5-methylcytosine-specific restriction endonuclease McrA